MVMAREKNRSAEKSYSITIADQCIHYRVIGDGPPLVLIHGFGVSGHIWQRILPYLSQHQQIFIVDLPGYGQSTFKPPWNLRAMAPLLITWLRQMHLTPVTLMGQSMGGAIAIHIAASAPELVKHLILVNAAGIPLNAQLPELTRRSIHSLLQPGNGGYPLALLYDVLQPRLRLFWQSAQEMIRSDFRSELASITLPTLIIWGECDVLLPLSLGQTLHDTLPHATLVTLPKCGHRPMLAQPELLSKLVIDFLQNPAM